MNARNRVPSSGSHGGNLFSTPDVRISESNRRMLEEQNDKKTSALAESVEKLKQMSIEINTEVDEQNRLLGQMGGQMESASEMLQGTLSQLGTLLNSGEGKHAVYLIGVVVLLFVVIYIYLFKLPTER